MKETSRKETEANPMKHTLIFLTVLLLAPLAPLFAAEASPQARPNILWFVVDDMSANFSCYGETGVRTPHVDRLAREGTRFTRAYATAPVCSPYRSALITGMYQTTIGAHHHRSGRGERRIQLPEGVRPIAELFQQAGYWTCIGSGLPGSDFRSRPAARDRLGKTDYNFDWDRAMYHSHDWAARQAGQPFFMQVQLHGGKLRGDSVTTNANFVQRVVQQLGRATDPASVVLPPYYPPDPLLLADWAAYLDSVRMTDWHVGRVIERLEAEGLLDNTLVIFFTDHGISHARGKQFLYDEGVHIPLILCGPGIVPGTVRKDLVEHIDIAAVSLAAAGIPIPETMQGRGLLAEKYAAREAVFAARDRCGEAMDRIRSVRTDRFLYIRNFHPRRPHLQPNQYKDSKAIVQRLRQLDADGSLDDLWKKLLFAAERPVEELYAYQDDPWQIHNLAELPEHADTLRQLRPRLERWIEETGDLGPESPEIYAREIADELKLIDPASPRHETFRKNAELNKQWAAEGK
jgi:arylsulfatase A-like enzyme